PSRDLPSFPTRRSSDLLNLLAGKLFEFTANAISFRTTATDDDTWASSVYVYADTVAGTFDLYFGDTCTFHAVLQQAADLHVFFDEVLVALTVNVGVSEPAGNVVFGNAEAESVWVNFLTHLVGPTFLIFIGCNNHGDVACAFLDFVGTTLS